MSALRVSAMLSSPSLPECQQQVHREDEGVVSVTNRRQVIEQPPVAGSALVVFKARRCGSRRWRCRSQARLYALPSRPTPLRCYDAACRLVFAMPVIRYISVLRRHAAVPTMNSPPPRRASWYCRP